MISFLRFQFMSYANQTAQNENGGIAVLSRRI